MARTKQTTRRAPYASPPRFPARKAPRGLGVSGVSGVSGSGSSTSPVVDIDEREQGVLEMLTAHKHLGIWADDIMECLDKVVEAVAGEELCDLIDALRDTPRDFVLVITHTAYRQREKLMEFAMTLGLDFLTDVIEMEYSDRKSFIAKLNDMMQTPKHVYIADLLRELGWDDDVPLEDEDDEDDEDDEVDKDDEDDEDGSLASPRASKRARRT